MRAFYIEASDGSASMRFPTLLDPTADVPERTCLVRVGDTSLSTRFATYHIWLSDAVISTFRSRVNLSNELMDCTFVYNNTDVFYNVRIRFRGSPFIRSGSNRNPLDRYAYRIDFNPEQKFRGREEINLDHTEGNNRGPLQERASYWFYDQMGLQYSSQEYVRPMVNGRDNGIYEDVQKIDGDYIKKWFSNDTEGYIHKIDDYFEYSANGTGHRNLDEGLKFDSKHPLLKETYRWEFEKRSHRENDNWDHLFDFAVAMNTRSNTARYEQVIESVIHPEHFARVLAIRHAVGDWDSYGYDRGKNNYFYYALPEGKWYLLPWDIDFTLGSGNGPTASLFSVSGGEFPEVSQFLNYPKYKQMYLQAFADLVNGPWQTSYGTPNPPTAFDLFLDDASGALTADGLGDGRRNGIKQFVRDRRVYILKQLPANLINSARQ
jgi:spore coat protein H